MNCHYKFVYFLLLLLFTCHLNAQQTLLSVLKSPIIFIGDERTAYRDPAVLYFKERIYLFFTLCKIDSDNKIYSYTAMSSTKDLKTWTTIKILTPRDQSLNFSSPGNIIRYKDEWILCLQTYPRPDYTVSQMPRFGTKDARLYLMRSKDLEHWSKPELIKVKGPETSVSEMGRMIDPYLLED
ncbi:MAG: sialidase family protein [Chitinophagaceae bacterium]